MRDTDLAAFLRAQNTCVYVTSHLIHSQHGSGAVIVASRKSGALESRLVVWWSGEFRVESVEQGAPGDAGVKTTGSTVCQQTMSTPEEQKTLAVQQLYVRLQQFQETLPTILQAARNELVEQVQNATSTTTHEEPMIRADRLFKLR